MDMYGFRLVSDFAQKSLVEKRDVSSKGGVIVKPLFILQITQFWLCLFYYTISIHIISNYF